MNSSAATLVTGANGFIGSGLAEALEANGFRVRCAVRQQNRSARIGQGDIIEVGDIRTTDWTCALREIDSIVHVAGCAHRGTINDGDEYRRVNTEATIRLAETASSAGVRRFVYLSSLKVLGDMSPHGRALTEHDVPNPPDEYAKSKWQAEQALKQLKSSMEIVVVRPPLVYGPQVRANFLRLMRWVDRGIWLPFGAVRNRRSLIYSGNLASAIIECIRHPSAAGMTFLVSDGEDVSTPELIHRIAASLGRPSRCLPMPPGVVRSLANLSGFGRESQRLLDSLVVDARLIRTQLSWMPPFTLDDGLRQTAAWFRSTGSQT